MIVYTAGPYQEIRNYHGQCIISKKHNIKVARLIAMDLWDDGYIVICPHLNTLDFEYFTAGGNESYAEGDLEIVARMDALVMLPNWYLSKGAILEKEHAEKLNIPVVIWPERP
jgi:hypothetical protein